MLYLIPLSASLPTLCKARWAQTFMLSLRSYGGVHTWRFVTERSAGELSYCIWHSHLSWVVGGIRLSLGLDS
jgi:hypothetical protein